MIVRPLKEARKALGLTQRQCAIAVGCTPQHIKRIERGLNPHPSHCRLLYELLLGFQTVEQLRQDAQEAAL